ncbi:MAG TPA: hypothetical protein VHN11_20845 [Xanthobacteraceae bacterium]|jgi:hypothetical protein|nr:hypothetical protein [Xanthobacteraceae bacterium]
MQGYRAFVIGVDGHIENCVEIICEDDAEAIRLAKKLVDRRDIELWQRARRIETFRYVPAPAEMPAKTRH